MNAYIRPIAITIAILTFFSLAVIACLTGSTPATSCYRATIGAIVAYLLVSLSARVVTVIIINAMVADRLNKNPKTINTNTGTGTE